MKVIHPIPKAHCGKKQYMVKKKYYREREKERDAVMISSKG